MFNLNSHEKVIYVIFFFYDDSLWMYGRIGGSKYWDSIYNHRTTKTNQKYPSVNL